MHINPPNIVHHRCFLRISDIFLQSWSPATSFIISTVLRSGNCQMHQFLHISDQFVLKCAHMSPGEGDIVLDFSESITVRNIFSKLGALQCLYTVQIIPRTDQDSVEVFTLILFSTSSSWSCSPKNVQCCHRQLTIKWNFRCLFSSQKSTSSWAVSASSEKGWQKKICFLGHQYDIHIDIMYLYSYWKWY